MVSVPQQLLIIPRLRPGPRSVVRSRAAGQFQIHQSSRPSDPRPGPSAPPPPALPGQTPYASGDAGWNPAIRASLPRLLFPPVIRSMPATYLSPRHHDNSYRTKMLAYRAFLLIRPQGGDTPQNDSPKNGCFCKTSTAFGVQKVILATRSRSITSVTRKEM